MQYPAPTGQYKICVNGGDKWSNHNVARLQISVGKPKHEGAKLAAAIEWSSHRFDKTILIISDTLQRHNFIAEGLTSSEAYRRAKELGRNWIAKNIQTILNANNEIEMTFWDDWLNHEHFCLQKHKIKKLYSQNIHFKHDIHLMAQKFSHKNNQNNNERMMYNQSIQYILEELAAFSIMYSSQKALDIYPGDGVRHILLKLKDQFYESAPTSFMSYAGAKIDFTLNKNYKNQRTAEIA